VIDAVIEYVRLLMTGGVVADRAWWPAGRGLTAGAVASFDPV
jgi:hypothetical protein